MHGMWREGSRRLLDKAQILVLSLGHAVVDGYGSFLAPLWPLLMSRFGLSLRMVGLLISAMSISGSMMQPVYGYISDRMGRRTLLMAGPILAGIFMGGIGLTPYRMVFVLFILLSSIGINAYHPQAVSMTSRISGRRKAFYMALFLNIGGIGYGLGPTIVTTFVESYGLERMFYLSVPGLLIAVLLYRFAPPALKADTRLSIGADLKDTFRTGWRALFMLYLIASVRAAASIGFMNFLSLFFKERGLSLTQGGHLISVFLLAGAPGGLVGGYLSDHVDRRRFLMGSLAVSTPLFLLALSAAGHRFFPLLLFVTGFVYTSSFPANVVMAQETASRNVSTVSAFVMGFAWGSGGLIAALFSSIAEAYSVLTALQGLAFLPLVAAGLAFTFPRKTAAMREQRLELKDI